MRSILFDIAYHIYPFFGLLINYYDLNQQNSYNQIYCLFTLYLSNYDKGYFPYISALYLLKALLRWNYNSLLCDFYPFSEVAENPYFLPSTCSCCFFILYFFFSYPILFSSSSIAALSLPARPCSRSFNSFLVLFLSSNSFLYRVFDSGSNSKSSKSTSSILSRIYSSLYSLTLIVFTLFY